MTVGVQIETQRLTLREITADNAGLIIDLFGDPATMESYRGTLTPLETKDWVLEVLTSWQEKGYGYWLLFLKDSSTFIGTAGLCDQEIDGKSEVEAGYVIQHPYWGQGYGSEVAHACYGFALNRTDLDRVVTIIDPRNSAALHLAKTYGLAYLKQTAKWGRTMHVYAKSRT